MAVNVDFEEVVRGGSLDYYFGGKVRVLRYFLRVIDVLPDIVEYDEVVVGEVLEEPRWCKGKRECYFVVPLPPRPRRATFTYRIRGGQHDERIIVLPSSYRERVIKEYAENLVKELKKRMVINVSEEGEFLRIIDKVLKFRTPNELERNDVFDGLVMEFRNLMKLITKIGIRTATLSFILPEMLLDYINFLISSILGIPSYVPSASEPLINNLISLTLFLRDEIASYHPLALVKLINRRFFIIIQRIRSQPYEELVGWRNLFSADFSIGFNVFPELLMRDNSMINSVHVVIKLPKETHTKRSELELWVYNRLTLSKLSPIKPLNDKSPMWLMLEDAVLMLDTSAGDKDSTQAYCYINAKALMVITREVLSGLIVNKALEPRIRIKMHYFKEPVDAVWVFNYVTLGIAVTTLIVYALYAKALIDVIGFIPVSTVVWVTGAVSVLLYTSDKPLLEEIYIRKHLVVSFIILIMTIVITLALRLFIH